MTLELVPWRGARVPVLSRDQISRYSTQDYINQLVAQQGYGGYMGPPMPVTTYGNRPVEPISTSFEGFAWGMLYVDGPVAAVEAYRLRVFGQAPLLFQEIVDGRAGDLFDDPALDRLRAPWTGATLSDLMKRTLIYADLAGNAFIADLEDELVLLRPDWVEIVLEKRMFRGQQLGWKQLGIVYYEGGRGRGAEGVPFLPGEYAHFIPGLPDPLATYRGMSWLTPLVREVQADKAAGDHKVAFFENSASPNLAVSLPKEITPAQFNEFVALMDSKTKGVQNAGRTLYTGGGADVTVIGANMQQQDFASVVGKGETRIANAGGVSPVLLSFSEGMQGSSLNAGNYTPAKRNFVDTTMRDLWANFAGSVGQMDAFRPPKEHVRLWYDGRDIPFLHEDAKDLAEIQQTQASTLASYVTNGWKPESAVKAVAHDDLTLLEHTGAFSVQLQPPGAAMTPDTNGNGIADEPQTGGSAPPPPDFGALRADFWEFDEDDILRSVEELFELDEEELERARYDVRVEAGHVGGGRFRKLSDVAAALLHDWSKGDGPDDPLQQFDRPQLLRILNEERKKALAAGDHERVARLTPRRGASEDQLKTALYEDVRGAVRQDRAAEKPSAKFTLQSGKLRDVDVAVYRDPQGRPALYRESDSGQRGALVKKFTSLDEMHAWAQDNGETHLADWAQKESAGKVSVKASAVKKAVPAKTPAKKAAPRPAPDPDAIDARLRDASPDERRQIVDEAAANQTQARRLASQLGVKGVSKLSRDDALAAIVAHYGDGTPDLHSTRDAASSKRIETALAQSGTVENWRTFLPAYEALTDADLRSLAPDERQRLMDAAKINHERIARDNLEPRARMSAFERRLREIQAGEAQPASAKAVRKAALRPLNAQEQAELDQIAAYSFHNSVIRRPEGKPTVNRRLDRLIAHGYLREENGQLRITDEGRRAAGQTPRSDIGPAKRAATLTSAQKVARSEKSRTQRAPGYPERAPVPADKASWSTPDPGYDPPAYTAPSVLANDRTIKPGGWADPADVHQVDHAFTSYEGPVKLDAQGRPQNPYTRTGIQDRGLLGKWGANFAADPIVTRINPDTGQLEMAAIVRGDSGEYAIPGGMVDEGEAVSATLGREFKEETGADLDMSGGREIYKGYVDDPRNTDNAWMETTAIHRHLAPDEAAAVSFPGPADSAEIKGVGWIPVDRQMLDNLYASHGAFVTEAIRQLAADKSSPIDAQTRVHLQSLISAPSGMPSDAPSPEAQARTRQSQFPSGQHSWSGHDGIDVTDQEERNFHSLPGTEQDAINDRIRTVRGSGGQRGTSFGSLPDRTVDVSPEREAEIRAAVEDIVGSRGLSLQSLREQLGGQFPRVEVDNVLQKLNRSGDWHVTAEVNQKALTPRARLAAVVIGNQDKHNLRVLKRGPQTPSPETAARTRQSAIDSARTVADTLTQVDELLSNGASPAALESRITAARTRGLPEADAQALLDAVRASREVEVENRIRAAYRQVLGDTPAGLSEWVGLADLREAVGNDVSRAELDAVLKKMLRASDYNDPGRVRMIPVANTKALKPRDREASLRYGEDQLHAISFGNASPRPVPTSAELDRVRADIASRHGLTPISSAGAVETYDPARHDTLNGRSIDGPVRVIRPGYEAVVNGETVRLSKPVVEPDIPATGDTVQPLDFLGRFNSAREAGLDATEAEQFAASGMSLEQWREAHRSQDLDEDDIERAEVDEDVVEPDDDEDDPSLDDITAMAAMDEASRAAGHDVTPGHDELHHYWVAGPGLAKWAGSPRPWRTLYALVTKAVRKNGRAVSPEQIKNWVSRWFIEVFHFAAGSDLNRVTHGKPPRGHRVGPG